MQTVTRRAIAVVAVLGGLACDGAESPPARPAAEDTTRPASATAPEPWYSAGRTLDLTRDGSPDSVHLEAKGERPDSLQVVLSFLVAGQEKHREEWGSSYELALLDSAVRGSPQVEPVLRAKLDSVLASVVVERLDAPGVRVMAEDSAILAGLSPRPTHRISFSYGYESTSRLVWDAPRSRFVRLWSCC